MTNQSPKLLPYLERIQLDRITALVVYIQEVFDDAFGAEADINEWDAVRIQEEFTNLFTPAEFERLYSTEFGKGVLIGAWIQAYIMGETIDEQAISEDSIFEP